MKKNLISITVGVPAFDEEDNIKKLLKAILSQNKTAFELLEVIVVVDGSTDKTLQRVKSIKNQKKIKVLVNKERRGQAYSQNKIFSKARGDTLVLFEADTYPRQNCLDNLARKISREKSLGFIQGNVRLREPKTLIGKAITDQINQYHKYILRNKKENMSFTTGRGARMFSKKVYEKLRWPLGVPEDTFALLWCRTNNVKTSFEVGAITFFQSPQTISDFVKTRQKISAGGKSLHNYFEKDVVKRVYKKPFFLRMKMLTSLLVENPLSFLIYSFLSVYVLIKKSRSFTDFWPVVISTKNTA